MESLPALPEHNMQLLISQAIDKGVPVETLERLLAMATQLKAEYAKEQFNIAMADFQEECQIIQKKKSVTTNASIVAYRYAPIEAIVAQVKPLLKKYGFSYSVDVAYNGTYNIVTCTAHHVLGHTRSSSYPAIPDSRENKMQSEVQRVASTLTFAKRYAFCNVFGILTGDEDNDARPETVKVTVTLATGEQIEEIENLIIESQLPLQGILQQCKVESLQEMTTAQGQSVITKMERYIERKNREKTNDT